MALSMREQDNGTGSDIVGVGGRWGTGNCGKASRAGCGCKETSMKELVGKAADLQKATGRNPCSDVRASNGGFSSEK